MPYQRLCRRSQGTPSQSARSRTNQRLDDAQYEALYQYLDYMIDLDLSVNTNDIRKAANLILQLNYTRSLPPVVSKQWPYNFMKQHPQHTKAKRHLTG